jgi:hypothetical protein
VEKELKQVFEMSDLGDVKLYIKVLIIRREFLFLNKVHSTVVGTF